MEIRRGTIIAFDAATHSATIQLDGSLAAYITGVEVAANILDADVIAGRYALVAWPDPANSDSAVIFVVYT